MRTLAIITNNIWIKSQSTPSSEEDSSNSKDQNHDLQSCTESSSKIPNTKEKDPAESMGSVSHSEYVSEDPEDSDWSMLYDLPDIDDPQTLREAEEELLNKNGGDDEPQSANEGIVEKKLKILNDSSVSKKVKNKRKCRYILDRVRKTKIYKGK